MKQLIFQPYQEGSSWWIGAFMNGQCIAIAENFGPFVNEAAARVALPSHAETIQRSGQVRLKALPKIDSLPRMSNLINFAYSISQQLGEEAVVKMCSMVEDHKTDPNGRLWTVPSWWRWTVWLGGALIIDRGRRRHGWPALRAAHPSELI